MDGLRDFTARFVSRETDELIAVRLPVKYQYDPALDPPHVYRLGQHEARGETKHAARKNIRDLIAGVTK